jgi:hypothetical protein
MQNDRGIGCKDCLVTRGVVSEEECIGCNGEKNCNEDYFPTKSIPKPKLAPKRKWWQIFKKKEQKIYTII